MTVASDQYLRNVCDYIVTPFVEQTKEFGMTYGLGPAGYDIRIAEDLIVPAQGYVLGSSFERFKIPNNIVAIVHDKSTWARQGIAVQNTVAEPGWEGWLTLEISNHSSCPVRLCRGMPIAQVIFHLLDQPTSIPYRGKYQDQKEGPQPAIFEE